MADDWTTIAPGYDPGEGLYGSGAGGGWSMSQIATYSLDMYGGIFGDIAQGNITGPPVPGSGSSGSVTTDQNGDTGTSTPPTGFPRGSTPQEFHGSGTSAAEQVYLDAQRAIATAMAEATHFVNTGYWGVPGYGWSGVFPVDPYRIKWFGPKPQQAAWAPSRFRNVIVGPRIDPFFSINPPEDTNDHLIGSSPYEYELDPNVDWHNFFQINNVVPFPGNPANDNNPAGPDGGPHNWDNYRRQAALARAIAKLLEGNLGQGL